MAHAIPVPDAPVPDAHFDCERLDCYRVAVAFQAIAARLVPNRRWVRCAINWTGQASRSR
jgi:hypothetical protein